MTTDQILIRLRNRFGRLARRYPSAADWVAARLTTDRFNGLPLTVLAGLLLVNVMILSEVAENVVNAEPMVQVDLWFTKTLFQARGTGMSTFFYGVTWLGSLQATLGFALLGSILLLRQHKRRNVYILWSLIGGVAMFVQVGKRTFVRERPLQVAYYPETGYSFPSGHSATAMILYGLLAYWLIRGHHSRWSRAGIGIVAVGLILMVGFSRIYLGVHFLSDVLGGYLLGLCWLIVGIVLTEWQRSSRWNEQFKRPSKQT
ncbi:phosphoesterase, PA-phosphatase related (plasmid) [Fibrella aestuarina BUZ 2]|uniref:Phosphoesterase, PA-phosphatase related n=1 Tax=Fibrella aestuarina BUZ 2 TaxID=1166018 RepID=I0KHB7_9BACT|nr:phosphatase PAP2 family protein [Fibrella aestuarina]CCH03520.1 phosphoesterase, PA-phosphatase related [Fibrella aestuarina BUZ 2]